MSKPETPPDLSSNTPTHGIFNKAAVVSDSDLAAIAGRELLACGGSCVDSAIGTLLVNGMMNAHSMGIGGGFLMVYAPVDKTDPVIAVDSREVAPLNSKSLIESSDGGPLLGPKSIAVPTELLGYWKIHRKYGRLPWSALFKPAIKLARLGYPVRPALKKAMSFINKNKQDLMNDKSAHGGLLDFYSEACISNPEDTIILKNEALAKTLERFASIKSKTANSDEMFDDEFQKREFFACFDDMLQDLAECGALVEKDDFEKYTVDFRPALSLQLDMHCPSEGLEIFTCWPSSGGCIVGLLIKLVWESLVLSNPIDNEETIIEHLFLEASKLAYQFFSVIGDVIAFKAEMNQLLNECLLTEEVTRRLASKIHPSTTYPGSYYAKEAISLTGKFREELGFDKPLSSSSTSKRDPCESDNDSGVDVNDCSPVSSASPALPPMTSGTSHVSVVDEKGDAVSVTSSINHYFGSCVLGKRSGVLFNNTLRDFEFRNRTRMRNAHAKHHNSSFNPLHFCAPGKRPISAQSPLILRSKPGSSHDRMLVIGGAGGSRITSAVGFVVSQWLFRQRSLDCAIAAPRIRHTYDSAQLSTNPHEHVTHKSSSDENPSGFIKEIGFCPIVAENLETKHNQVEAEDPIPFCFTVVMGVESSVKRGKRVLTAACDPRKGGLPAGY